MFSTKIHAAQIAANEGISRVPQGFRFLGAIITTGGNGSTAHRTWGLLFWSPVSMMVSYCSSDATTATEILLRDTGGIKHVRWPLERGFRRLYHHLDRARGP